MTTEIHTVTLRLDVGLLREQRDWVQALPCRVADLDPREGVLGLLNTVLDQVEAV